jgi:hypothetical protein
MDGTDGTAQAGDRDTAPLGVGADRDGGLYAASPAVARSRDGSGRHGSTESRWSRPDSSGNFGIAVGPRKMDRMMLGLSVVANVGLDMPCSPA